MNKQYYELINETLFSFKCDNGLQVYLLQKKDYYKTYGILATKFGSLYQKFKIDNQEYQVIDGAAHFLEHKMFEKDDYDVMDIFNRQSASTNAFTSFDKTAYLFNATDNVTQNINTLLDFVQDLQLSDESIEKEKPIIASEIAMYDDEVEWQAFFKSLNTMYHHNPVKIDIAGDKETIYQITKENLELYYKYFYHPSNMVLFICGNFDLEEVKQCVIENQLSKNFKELSYELIQPFEPYDVATPYDISYLDINKMRYTFAFKINEFIFTPEKQEIVMSFLTDLLFAKSANLFQDLINKQIITSDYEYNYTQDHTFNYAYNQLFFTCNDEDELTNYLYNYFKKDLRQEIKAEEFEAVKAKYLGDYLRIFNNPETIANTFISYHFLGYDLFNIIETIKNVTLDDLYQALKLFNLDFSTISIIKPKE